MFVRLAPFLVDIKGRLGGQYFHRDKSGLHIAQRPRALSTRSPAQRAGITAYSGVAQAWSEGTLSAADKTAWGTFSESSRYFPKSWWDAKAKRVKWAWWETPYRLNGWHLFIKANFNLFRWTGEIIKNPKDLPPPPGEYPPQE